VSSPHFKGLERKRERRSRGRKEGGLEGGFRGDLRGKESYPPRSLGKNAKKLQLKDKTLI
jgi:hypothetical protein